MRRSRSEASNTLYRIQIEPAVLEIDGGGGAECSLHAPERNFGRLHRIMLNEFPYRKSNIKQKSSKIRNNSYNFGNEVITMKNNDIQKMLFVQIISKCD